MMRRTSIIAIDGPAASGKSSTAQMVAEKLDYLHVDSGSLYRAATAAILRAQPNPDEWTERSVLDAARGVELRAARTSFYPVLDNRAIEEEIRGADVTRNVSRVAQMPRVREWVNAKVRDAAASSNVVVDGRDMGTVVFPEADLKKEYDSIKSQIGDKPISRSFWWRTHGSELLGDFANGELRPRKNCSTTRRYASLRETPGTPGRPFRPPTRL